MSRRDARAGRTAPPPRPLPGGSDAGCLYGDSYDVSLAPGSQTSWANNSGRIIAMQAAEYLGK